MSEFGIETETLEFKSSTSQLKRAIESLAAMLNKSGKGEVLFGVDDKGKRIGQQVSSKTLSDISATIADSIKPSIVPIISVLGDEPLQVISVKVKGDSKPYSANGVYLLRSGSENRKIEPEQMRELVFLSTDETIAKMESINQTPSFSQLKQLFLLSGLEINQKNFEKNAGLVNKDGKYNELSYILSDSNDVSIKVVIFSGEDKSELLYRNEYGYKCLLLAMQQAMDYVISLNETRVILDGSMKRQEKTLFHEKSFREAWINACLHNRWSSLVPPAIYIYSNRIEIISHGGLPYDFPLDDFYSGVSHPINRQLMRIMGQLGIVEQTGHGVPEIVRNYGKEAFDVSPSRIIVTLAFPFPFLIRHGLFDGLSPSEKKLLSAIATRPSMTTNELSKVIGVSVPRVNQLIKSLKDLGKIKREGSKKDGYWKVL